MLGLFFYFRHRQRTEQHYQVPPREENFRDIGMTDILKVQVSPENIQELSNERPVIEIYSNDHTSHLGINQHELPSTSYT
jgi:hypothetical protein